MLNFKSTILLPSLLTLSLLVGCESITFENARRLMSDASRPDARREGIAALSTRWPAGKRPPYPEYYAKIAQHDPDYTVRAMAIRALNLCRDHSATKIFINGLRDDSELVRLESAKALANIPDPEAVPALMQVLAGNRIVTTADGRPAIVAESKDVRIAAADALRQYRDLRAGRAPGMPEPSGNSANSESALDVARVLIGYLNDTDFGVAWQTRQSLIAMTGQDLKYDEAAWLQFLVGPSKPFG